MKFLKIDDAPDSLFVNIQNIICFKVNTEIFSKGATVEMQIFHNSTYTTQYLDIKRFSSKDAAEKFMQRLIEKIGDPNDTDLIIDPKTV